MSKKGNDKTKSKNKNKKCLTCEYFNKKDDKCKLDKNCNIDFTKCSDYLVNEKLIHF